MRPAWDPKDSAGARKKPGTAACPGSPWAPRLLHGIARCHYRQLRSRRAMASAEACVQDEEDPESLPSAPREAGDDFGFSAGPLTTPTGFATATVSTSIVEPDAEPTFRCIAFGAGLAGGLR